MSFYIFSSRPASWVAAAVVTAVLFASVTLVATEWLIRTRINPADGNLQHREFFYNSPCLNAVFGDSRPVFAVTAPGQLVNQAHWGENQIVFEKKIEQYVARCKPGRIILQSDPHMLSLDREKQNVDYMLSLYRSPPRFFLLEERHYRTIINYWRRFIAGRGAIASAFLQRQDGSFSRFDRFSDLTDLQKAASIQKNMPGREPMKMQAILRSKVFASLTRTLALLKEKSIDVCMVGMPTTKEYRKVEETHSEVAPVRALLATLARDNGFRYRDLSAWGAEQEWFADEDHMNDAGAKAFSPFLLAQCGWS